MNWCRFNLKLNVYGLPIDKYDTMSLGDKYAKIVQFSEDDSEYNFILESRHKNRDFFMVIESIWRLPKRRKTFKIINCVVEIKIFDLVQEIYTIPESHLNTLKKWYERKKN